ncbi:MAG: dual specificity protein phosphatase family protein [Paludibacteraceae bacterium]|nr:dual specificity protein phosphatase family protein [Paludibacteraceae bacterium]
MQITDYTFANITARPFLTLDEINNKWTFTENTKHVINVCMYREPEVIDAILSKGATFDWFPTDERPMDLNIVLQAVAKLAEYDRDGSHIIVHCLHGDNRSRTVVEAYHFAKLGFHFEDECKGYTNHLVWNCSQGYLPPLPEMEKLLKNLK